MENFEICSSSRPIDVYLSFRGDEETSKFTDRLWAALESDDLNTFWDDKKLDAGDSNIPPLLLKAIQQSNVSIVVFSKDYASSRWCLQELSQIVECLDQREHTVLPVFYDVYPWEVEYQSNSYEKAFAEYDERSQKMPTYSGEVQSWREAMIHVAMLPGWEVRYDSLSQVIDDIVRVVKRILRQGKNDLVGMRSRVQALEKLLDLGSDDVVRVVGICGMNGIGKTTLARVLYDRISHHFDASYFSINVNDVLKSTRTGQHKSTLIVLDGVDLQLNLIPLIWTVKSNGLGRGSRIIITTRDERVLKVFDQHHIYRVELLTHDEALQLICRKAFKSDFPLRGYEEQINKVLEYANGLPLAIVILGSLFCNQSACDCRRIVVDLKTIPYSILKVLRTSFDELEDPNIKEMFLDVACFFAGKEINSVKKILQSCGFSAEEGIQLLIEKSLITIFYQRIQMHSLLQEMGRELVRRESPSDPGERSRLWDFDDIYHVMQDDAATDKVKAIVLDLEDFKDITLRIEALSLMKNLKLLIFRNVNFVGTLSRLSNKLKYISWHQYPFTSLPSNFDPQALVELIMPDSWTTEITEGEKSFPCLRNLNLCGSKNLIKMPDFTWMPKLEELDLQGCNGLLHLDPSVAQLSKLKFLNLRNCSSLISIPNSLFSLKSLEILNLACCTKLAYCLNFFPFEDIDGIETTQQ